MNEQKSIGAAVGMAGVGALAIFTAAVWASGGLAAVLGVGGGLAATGAVFLLAAWLRN